jgi:hypothetical protein
MNYKILLSLGILTFAAFTNKIAGQDTIKSKVSYGIRLISNYDFEVKQDNNFRTMHFAPLFSANFNHHNFYLRPQYSYIFQEPAALETYDQNSYGLNFGYRYYSNYVFKNTRLFGEFNYSIFQVRITDHQLGPPYETKHEEIYIENTGSLGLEYSIIKKFQVFLGFGFGSYDGFFLIFENFTLTSYLGIEYTF